MKNLFFETLKNNQIIVKEDYLNRQKKDILTDSIFYSYNTKIATIQQGVLYFTDFWNYSKTTSKYLYQYLDKEFDNITEHQNEIKEALQSNNKKANFEKLIKNNIIKII